MIVLRKYLFEMDSDAFGHLKVRRLTAGAISDLLKRLPNYQKSPGREVTISGASVLCIDTNGNTIDGSKLSDQELLTFSEQFLATYPRVTMVDDAPVSNIVRQENEDSVDYCGRVIADEIRSHQDQMAAIVEKSGALTAVKELNKISDMFKENTKLAAFSKMMGASDSLRSAMMDVERFSASNLRRMAGIHDAERLGRNIYEDMVKSQASMAQIQPKYERINIPMPPPNPVYETNAKLEDLTDQVEVFTGSLTEHLTASAVALKGVAEQIEKGSRSTNRQNNIMIGLAAVSVIIAIIATYFGYLGYTMGIAANAKSRPPAVVAPMEKKSRPVAPKKAKKEAKEPHSTSSSSQVK